MLSTKLEKQMSKIKKVTDNVTDFKKFFSNDKEFQMYIINQKHSTRKFHTHDWSKIARLEEISMKPIVQWLSIYNSDVDLVFYLNRISDAISLNTEHLEELFKSTDTLNELYSRYDNSSSGRSIKERVLYFILACYKHNFEFKEELLDQFIEGSSGSNDDAKIWRFVFEVITRGYQISPYSFLKPRQNYHYSNNRMVLYYNKVFQLDKKKILSQTEHSRLSNILESLRLSNDAEQKVDLLIEKMSIKEVTEILSRYNHLDLKPSLSELEKMEMKLEHNQLNPETNIFETLYGPKISVLFTSKLLTESSKHFIESLLKKKKRKFVETIIDIASESDFQKVDHFIRVDLYENIEQLVNLNTLSKDDIKRINDSSYKIYAKSENLTGFFKDKDVKLTWNEYNELINKNNQFYFEFYNEAISRNIKIDERLKMLRQLPLFTFTFLKDEQKIQVNNLNLKHKKDFITSLVDKFSQRGFKQSKKDLGIMTSDDLVSLFSIVYFDEIKPFLNEIKTLDDIKVILDFDLEEGISLQQIKQISYENEEEFQAFKRNTNFSKEFINDNLDNYIAFHEKGLTKVFNTLYNGSESRQKKNLTLITKAEIAGKLSDIKFVDEDFAKEIGLDISDEAKTIWKKDFSIKEDTFKIEETSDFEKTIRLGQYPVETCQHWKGGSYSDALLSNYDTNKKLITAYYKGAYVARAVVRLTKISDRLPEKKVVKKEEFGFIDIEQSNEQLLNNMDTNNSEAPVERLAIFLEYTYTSLDSENAKKAKDLFVQLLKEKAVQMGAELVLSNDYNVSHPSEEKDLFIYISKSKNGKQYLDSVGGYARESKEKTYHSSSVKIITK